MGVMILGQKGHFQALKKIFFKLWLFPGENNPILITLSFLEKGKFMTEKSDIVIILRLVNAADILYAVTVVPTI